MTLEPLYLVDRSSAKIALLQVALAGDLFSGTICLDETPPQLKHLFDEFEEMVEGQVFPVADEIEGRIDALQLRVEFPNGTIANIEDLQVFQSTRRVSFKVRRAIATPK